MQQWSLFDMGDDFMSLMPPKEEKKVEKVEKKTKEEKKTSKKEKKSSGKQASDIEVLLPVKIIFSTHSLTYSGKSPEVQQEKLSEILRQLVSDGYKELLIPGVGADYLAATGSIYISVSGVSSNFTAETIIYEEETENDGRERKIYVSDCGINAEFDATEFSETEICIKDVAGLWEEINPQYKGCSYAFNGDEKVLMPILEKVTTFGDTLQINCGGEEKEINAGSLSEVKTALFGPDFPLNIEVRKDFSGNYRVVFCTSKNTFFLTLTKDVKATKTATVKYLLPLDVFVATWGETYRLTTEDFDGKDKVTLDQVKKALIDKYPICKCLNDTDRKIDCIYLEDLHRLSLMLVSGRKGADVATTSFYQGAICDTISQLLSSKPNFHGVFFPSEGGEERKVDCFPFGTFVGTFGKGNQCNKIVSAQFIPKLPKIPSNIFAELVDFFRREFPNEAIARVMWDGLKYFIVKGTGRATGASIEYEFDPLSMLSGVQVMEIHSHGHYSAFFSSTDDHDERFIPGIYGVIGNLSNENVSMCFRAGYEGVFTPLSSKDLFYLN